MAGQRPFQHDIFRSPRRQAWNSIAYQAVTHCRAWTYSTPTTLSWPYSALQHMLRRQQQVAAAAFLFAQHPGQAGPSDTALAGPHLCGPGRTLLHAQPRTVTPSSTQRAYLSPLQPQHRVAADSVATLVAWRVPLAASTSPLGPSERGPVVTRPRRRTSFCAHCACRLFLGGGPRRRHARTRLASHGGMLSHICGSWR